MTGPVRPKRPQLPVGEPNWTSYEEIEPHINPDYGSLLWQVIPVKLRWYTFAPTDAPPSKLRKFRQCVHAEYESVLTFLGNSWVPSGPQDLAVDDVNKSIVELFDDRIDARWFLFSARLRDSQDLAEYRQAVTTAIERYEMVLQRCENLLEEPERAFLRESEQDDLIVINSAIADTVESGKKCIEAIDQEQNEIETIIHHRLPKWESEFAHLKEQAAPYIRLADYAPEDEIIESVEALHNRIAAARKPHLSLVSESDADQLRKLEQQTANLAQELRDAREEYADRFAQALRRFSIVVLEPYERLDKDTDAATREPLSELPITLDRLETELTEFVTGPQSQHVSAERLQRLAQCASELRDFRKEIEKEIDECERRLAALSTQAEVYLELAEFLPDDELVSEFDSLHRTAIETQKQYPVESLSEPAGERLQRCADQAVEYAERLKDSRPQFADLRAARLRALSESALMIFEKENRHVQRPNSQSDAAIDAGMTLEELRNELRAVVSGPCKQYLAACRLNKLKKYKFQLKELLLSLELRVASWWEEAGSIEKEAQPYLNLEQEPGDDELVNRIYNIKVEIEGILHQYPVALFPRRTVRRLATIDRKITALREELKDSYRTFAQTRVVHLEQLSVTVLEGFQDWSAKNIEREIKTHNRNEVVTDISEIISKIAKFVAAPYSTYVDSNRIKNLTQLQMDLATQERAVQEQITTIQKDLKKLDAEATPYLELTQYLESDELLNQISTLLSEIASLRSHVPVTLLTPAIHADFKQIESDVPTLFENLRQSRRKYAAQQYEHTIESANEALEVCRERLGPAKKHGKPIESPNEIEGVIEQSQTEIEQAQTAVWTSQLKEDEHSTLDDLQTELKENMVFLTEKVRFDERLRVQQGRYRQLRADASPYLEYEQYLTSPMHDRLIDRINQLVSGVDTVAAETRFELLADADRNKLRELRQDAGSIKSHLTDYNDTFVHRQRQECSSLFNEIGPNNLELTEQQQRAVIRNGIYNQVIAAAGTGKTLTLTTRVAYLVQKQGVDPERILVVAYTNEAAAEMKERLSEHFGITEVEVRTVHSFGFKLIRQAKSTYAESVDEHEIINFVDREIRKAREADSSEFLTHFYQFLVHFDDVYYDEEDFKTRKEYVETRAEQEYVTLRGTEVKSRAEKLIADFLHIHQVEYRYEDRASWADSASDKAGYTPDFYLPDYDIYIEHWGIDESGSVAPWFSQSSEEYRTTMEWKREQFSDVEYNLVETYEFEHEAGQLKQVLHHRLSCHDVELDRMSFEELVDTTFEYNEREKWIKRRFEKFMTNAKRFDVTADEIEENLNQDNPRQYHFGQCGLHLLKQYIPYLVSNSLVDFTDMVQEAVELVQEHPDRYKQQYEHLLVDEFQDIGKGKLEIIRELTGEDGAKLFAVGDDWQSIFSFQGAVIDFFIDFEEYFGKPVRTDLTVNFRSPAQIIAAGNAIIENNSEQLKKTVQPTVDQDSVPRIHPIRGYRFYDYVRRVRQYTVALIQEYCQKGTDPTEVMVLCRYDGAVPYLDKIKEGLESQQIPYIGQSDRYPGPNGNADDGVSVYSLYQAKGREAERVILVHAAEGQFGFPPDGRENELLEPVQPISIGGLEEERRAFYVAVTRSERTLDILTRGGKESRFIDEINEYVTRVDTRKVQPLDDVGELMDVTAKVDKLLNPWNKQHQRGILADKHGGSARFVSWESNDPPTLVENEWYNISGVRVDQYKGEKELVITGGCSVRHLSESPTVSKSPETDE